MTDGSESESWNSTTMRMTKEQRIRLLRAKSHELEARTKTLLAAGETDDVIYLAADVALVFELLADHMESADG